MTALQQTHGEILRVVTDWKTFHAPKNLKEDDSTANLLVDYIVKNYGGIASFTALNAAVAALGSKVLVPEPTQAEIAAKLDAKMRRDYLDSIKPQPKFEDRVKAETAKREAKQAEKRQADAQSQINALIDNYTINLGPGRIDHARSEHFRGLLRATKAYKGGKYDAVETLKLVQEALAKMP